MVQPIAQKAQALPELKDECVWSHNTRPHSVPCLHPFWYCQHPIDCFSMAPVGHVSHKELSHK